MKVLNIKELAEYLNCSVSVIRTLVRNGQIPYFRIGSKLNFNKEAIDSWIHNQEVQNMKQKDYSLQVKHL